MPDTSINWGSVADWVSGFGSLFAGVVALYLARASARIRLKGRVGLRVVIGAGIPMIDLVSISVTNVGTRATVVNNIEISVGRFSSKRNGVIAVVKGAYSVGVPYPLADGEQATWGIPNEEKKWLRELCAKLINSESDIRSLRFHICTNHGAKLSLKPEETMLDVLRELLLEKLSNSPATRT